MISPFETGMNLACNKDGVLVGNTDNLKAFGIEIDEDFICDDCYRCNCFWLNNDSGIECQGCKEKCHEFIEMRNNNV